MFKHFNNYLKSKLPKTIFYRFVLIVLLPLFLVQIASFCIFFYRYWNITLKNNTDLLTNEIFILNNKYEELNKQNIQQGLILKELNLFSNIEIDFIYNPIFFNNRKNKDILFFNNSLNNFLNELNFLNIGKINLYKVSNNYYNVEIEKDNGILLFTINKDRIFIKRIDLIIFWNIVSFSIISIITLIFVKNQVKSIKKLEQFANEFSYLEKYNVNFKPTGAKEIREMGDAFLKLTRKIKQLIETRTIMLAQISHDLRTPLTRMKLQIELMDENESTTFLKKDLEEMEKMINEYLLFTKGENENDFKQVNIKLFFDEIINNYKRSGYNVNIAYSFNSKNIHLKIDSFKRCINNLINNSLKYHKKYVNVKVKTTKQFMVVNVEDDGCGIPDDFFSKVKTPFFKINNKENKEKNKNIGLGLSIVQNIVNMHGGRMFFKKSTTLGGLNVELTIPMTINKRSFNNVK